MSHALYVMVSLPEEKVENVFESPVILGVFDSKESAQNAWKKRTFDFKDIKAKTVHKYYETFSTEQENLPQYIYLWATYYVYGFSEDETPEFVFMPYANGYFETYDEYSAQKTWIKEQNPISQKEFCEDSGFVFYASNEDIIEKIEINRLVKIHVQLIEKNL